MMMQESRAAVRRAHCVVRPEAVGSRKGDIDEREGKL